jgi:DNA-binding transcriptional MerR regulator
VKIGDLVQRTQVSKETVHYYIREGLLPKPRKLGRNVAEYDDHYVERIRLIKELQDQYYLPLAVIGNILKNQKKSPEGRSILSLRREYFQPVDHLLPKEVAGEEGFLKATGLGKNWLAKMETWGIISPEVTNGRKVFSQDDITIGKLIVKMDKIGLGVRNGFKPEALKHYRDLFRKIVIMSHKYYMEGALGKIPPDEFSKRILQGREVMSVFFYHLYRKLSREEYKRILGQMEGKEITPEEKGSRESEKNIGSPPQKNMKKLPKIN